MGLLNNSTPGPFHHGSEDLSDRVETLSSHCIRMEAGGGGGGGGGGYCCFRWGGGGGGTVVFVTVNFRTYFRSRKSRPNNKSRKLSMFVGPCRKSGSPKKRVGVCFAVVVKLL